MVLLIVLAVGAGIGVAVEKFFAGFERERRRAYYAGRKSGQGQREQFGRKPEPAIPAKANDFAADQLKTVSRASFTSRSLLNKAEAKVFEALDKAVIARNPSWQVMAQAQAQAQAAQRRTGRRQ